MVRDHINIHWNWDNKNLSLSKQCASDSVDTRAFESAIKDSECRGERASGRTEKKQRRRRRRANTQREMHTETMVLLAYIKWFNNSQKWWTKPRKKKRNESDRILSKLCYYNINRTKWDCLWVARIGIRCNISMRSHRLKNKHSWWFGDGAFVWP